MGSQYCVIGLFFVFGCFLSGCVKLRVGVILPRSCIIVRVVDGA